MNYALAVTILLPIITGLIGLAFNYPKGYFKLMLTLLVLHFILFTGIFTWYAAIYKSINVINNPSHSIALESLMPLDINCIVMAFVLIPFLLIIIRNVDYLKDKK